MPPPPPLPPQQASNVPSGPVPLWAPYYNAPFGVAVRRFFTKYATFSGRASRAEYWWWFLVSAVIGVIFSIILQATGGNNMNGNGMTAGGTVVYIIYLVWALVILIPGLALLSRRLHDANHSFWWIFIALIPLVGGIILLVFVLTGPKPEGARFDRPTS
ncbi:DUF805 domain-containing protein [Subtercola endophyticus]|uniref:DUF805 domain-containing protein n=1 Tax=Subtercola endophyticus TaxID=2895559 RepID=UPI001E554B88|nr:DUF805 domain-containing protein [Subtercola endophyticus]UFS61265.1 DUF805 domain-containing protein [Subtercola endophyticus]